MTTDKTAKLLSRGSEDPKVARAARDLSDLLTRISLGQALYAAEIIEKMFPDITQAEAESLAHLFEQMATYFRAQAGNDYFFDRFSLSDRTVRSWKTDEGYFYQIHKLFSVLACDRPYCADLHNCWETRSAFCEMDAYTTPENAELQPQYELGIASNLVNVLAFRSEFQRDEESTEYVRQRVIGYVKAEDVPKFRAGDVSVFEPIPNWKTTFSKKLAERFGLSLLSL